MRRFFMITAIVLLSLAPIHAVYAQSIEAQLRSMNSMDPLQNPKYTPSADVLSGRLLDARNKVVGDVDDILVKTNGSIVNVIADFDNLNLRQEVPVDYNATGLRPVSNGYVMNITSDQVRDAYPSMLANIQTASGDSVDQISVHRLVGMPIKSSTQRSMGEIKDVLFTSNGAAVDAIYANLNYSNLRNAKIAIPFKSVSFKEKNGRIHAVIDERQLDIIKSVAEGK